VQPLLLVVRVESMEDRRAARRLGGWRLVEEGVAKIEQGDNSVKLCVCPCTALEYSRAEIVSGTPLKPPYRSGVLEVKARFSGEFYGTVAWGFWSGWLQADRFYAVRFTYINTPGPYPLKGMFIQVGAGYIPVALHSTSIMEKTRGLLAALKSIFGRSPRREQPRLLSPRSIIPGFDPTKPHIYRVAWRGRRARFFIDGRLVARRRVRDAVMMASISVENALYTLNPEDPGLAFRRLTLENAEEFCLEISRL